MQTMFFRYIYSSKVPFFQLIEPKNEISVFNIIISDSNQKTCRNRVKNSIIGFLLYIKYKKLYSIPFLLHKTLSKFKLIRTLS
jgi:hypothetical protein